MRTVAEICADFHAGNADADPYDEIAALVAEVERHGQEMERLVKQAELVSRAAERRFAEHEKANIASRRSICALSDKYKTERDAALGALAEALPVVEYVSAGRGYIGVKPYPDATARVANHLIREALDLAALPLNVPT